MRVQNVLAHFDVSDYDKSVEWYGRLLGRKPDRLPMEGCAEWQLADTGGLQVYRSDRAVGSTVVIAVDDIDDTVAQVNARGIRMKADNEPSGNYRLATIEDSSGNVITFAEEIRKHSPVGTERRS